MQRIRQPFNVNALALVGALAALDDDEHVARTLEVNRAGHGGCCRGAFDRLGLAVRAERGELHPGARRAGRSRSTRRCSAAA